MMYFSFLLSQGLNHVTMRLVNMADRTQVKTTLKDSLIQIKFGIELTDSSDNIQLKRYR